jgi:hypothetical protein
MGTAARGYVAAHRHEVYKPYSPLAVVPRNLVLVQYYIEYRNRDLKQGINTYLLSCVPTYLRYVGQECVRAVRRKSHKGLREGRHCTQIVVHAPAVRFIIDGQGHKQFLFGKIRPTLTSNHR